MTWRVDQVENILLSVGAVGKGDGLAFDGDSPLTFNVHIIQDLVFEIPRIHHASILDEAVGKGRFSVINMCDDAEFLMFFMRLF